MTITINGTTGISGIDGSASTPALQGSDTDTGVSFGTNTVTINTGGTARVSVDGSGTLTVSGGKVDLTNRVGIGSPPTTNVPVTIESLASNSYAVEFYHHDNTAVGSITTSGSATAFNTSSDYRLKENIVGISDGITRIKTLKPSRFNFKTDKDTTVDGFIAHEVTTVPEAIKGTKDQVDSDNNPVYQGIDQSKLVPLLTAALQEAISKIEVLETKVAALEAA